MHIRYRSDIDGMRAIAVLAVVIYHAFPQNLPGGFVGVDIFFVISGYLISGILFKGVKGEDFSFREFYARRIRRLFPSLITVLLLCLGYGLVVLLSDEYRQIGKHVAAGTLFIQNIAFWQESGYFDTAANLKPLLHLWSLAVEEQFYIIFPPLLILFWKKKWPMAILLWILLMTSFIGNIIMSYQSRETDFFLTPYRVWEFLAGSLLAWWHFGKNDEKKLSYAGLLSAIGAVLVAFGMILIHQGDRFPGWRAILPVAGSVMLIAAGRQAWINDRILSHPALIWIGLISYPLYLFHWPALSFVRIVKGERPADIYLAGALIVTFILTVATYYFIEKPIRSSKSRWAVPALTAAFFITGALGVLTWQGFISAVNCPPEIKNIQAAASDRRFFEGCELVPSPRGICIIKIGGNGRQTLFFGDSNIQQYVPRISEILKNNKGDTRGAIIISYGGTPPIRGIVRKDYPQCGFLFETLDEYLSKDSRIDRIVIGARWKLYFKEKRMYWNESGFLSDVAGRRAALADLKKLIDEDFSGRKVTLLLSVPSGKELDPKNFLMRSFLGGGLVDGEKLTLKDYLRKNGDLEKDIAAVGIESGAQVIDPLAFLSSHGICLGADEEGPIRYDDSHLRPGFVRKHLKYLDQTLDP
jgi:peptidoglycan/LPS O-acetylase OafA/YrhL